MNGAFLQFKRFRHSLPDALLPFELLPHLAFSVAMHSSALVAQADWQARSLYNKPMTRIYIQLVGFGAGVFPLQLLKTPDIPSVSEYASHTDSCSDCRGGKHAAGAASDNNLLNCVA
jgi:hypothetical protein